MLGQQARVGNRAVTRLVARSEVRPPVAPSRTPSDIARELRSNGRDLNHARSVANDHLEGRGEPRPPTVEDTIERLRDLAAKGDRTAQGLLDQLEPLVERRNGLIEELGRAHAGSGPRVDPGVGTEKFETTVADRVAEDATADLAERAAGRTAEGLTLAETVGAALEVIGPILDVLFLAQAGYAIGKALIFHNPAEMDPDQVKLMHLMDTNVVPAALKALQSHEKEARDLALRDPERDVHAKVTMTITYGAEGSLSKTKEPTIVYEDEHLEDAQFNNVSVGYDSKAARKDGGETHHHAGYGDHRRRMQVITFPILLNPLGQSRGLRRFAAMRANASHAIAHGRSARSVAEGTHWVGDHMGPGGYDWSYLDDREEARRKKAMGPSHHAQIELAAKIAFTEAYIDAASDHIEQPTVKKLYDDAVRYYDELKRTVIDPMYGSVTKPPQQESFPFPLKPR